MFSAAILAAILDFQTCIQLEHILYIPYVARPTIRPIKYVWSYGCFYVRGSNLGCHLEYFDFPKGARVA